MLSPKKARYSKHLKSLQAVKRIQDEMSTMQNKLDGEMLKLEHKFEIDKKPIYAKREEAIRNISNFWVTALMNHPYISRLVDESEEEYLFYVSGIEVKVDDEIVNTFRIIFYFNENPYFKNSSLVKEYLNIAKGTDDTNIQASSQITASVVLWKEGQDISEKLKERQSFLYWLTSNEFEFDYLVAQVIKNIVWPDPLQFYPVDDNSEGDDDNDDVIIIEDSDDENSNQEESEGVDSQASSEVTQNEN